MITVILDFISQNWELFEEHCKHHGLIDIDEVEKELTKLEKTERRF